MNVRTGAALGLSDSTTVVVDRARSTVQIAVDPPLRQDGYAGSVKATAAPSMRPIAPQRLEPRLAGKIALHGALGAIPLVGIAATCVTAWRARSNPSPAPKLLAAASVLQNVAGTIHTGIWLFGAHASVFSPPAGLLLLAAAGGFSAASAVLGDVRQGA